MPIKLYQIIILSTAVIISGCSSLNTKSCLKTRAAFDIGSGSTKMKIYNVNTCQNKIISQVQERQCAYSEKVGYKEALKGRSAIPSGILKTGVKVLSQMRENAIKCGATEFQATATSAFRQASNGEQAVKKLEESGINISIISQVEEARLGFLGATSKKPELDPKNLCVWDIGGSSMQIVCTHKGESKIFLGHLASVPFKEHILKLKSSNKNSPNPISQDIYSKALLRTKLEAETVMKIMGGNQLSNKPFIGIGGVHYYAVSKAINKPVFTVKDLEEAINKRLNKDNQALGGGKYANTALSNIILVKGMMESLNIYSLSAVQVNLTEGLALSKTYW